MEDASGSSPQCGDPPPRSETAASNLEIFSQGKIIGLGSSEPTRGWVIPFTVVEDKKPTGRPRRFMGWPKNKNDADAYEAQMPLAHITAYLPAVLSTTASIFDLKASFLPGTLTS